jgi:Fe-S cluster assembly protein SufD
MAPDPIVAALTRAFLACAAAAKEPAWLAEKRAAAMQRFSELGLPTRKQEAWRFTDLRPLTASGGLPMPAPGTASDPTRLAAHRLPGTAHRIVLVNGKIAPDLCQIGTLPPGVWLGSLADAAEQCPDLAEAAFGMQDTLGAQPFGALNAAFFADGVVLALDAGVVLPRPVEILHYGDAPSPSAFHLRNAIIAAPGSSAQVTETYAGAGAGWSNLVTAITLSAGAVLRHAVVQVESGDATHLATTRAHLEAGARYDAFVLAAGARLSRHDIQATIAGVDAAFGLRGAYLLRGEQEATIAILADHQAGGGKTSELVKGVLDGHAHGVFLGSVLVREGADGTDARQLNRNLMLSRSARVDTKPELMIHADEVACSHGATVGDLDDAAMFYLQARGIDPATARGMLVEAFATEVFDAAALPPDIDAHVRRYLAAWLDTARSAA